jgi:hypothetical protein
MFNLFIRGLIVKSKYMRNLIIILSLALLPLPTLAYDALTPTETQQAIANNANFLLKADYQKYCETEPLRIEKEIAAINSMGLKDYIKTRRMEPFFAQMQTNSNLCEETKQKIKDQVLPTTEQNKNLGCGTNYIKRGGVCITASAVCQMYFGQNVSGVKSISDKDVAECTCNAGYSMTNGVCLANNTPNVASAVLGTNTVNSDQQLREIIAQLTAQVASLILQLNAKVGR